MIDILNEMFRIARTGDNVERYATDFLVHDVQALLQAPKGAVFAWGIRPSGTHLFRLNPEVTVNARATRDALGGFRDGRYFPETQWYLVTVTGSSIARDRETNTGVRYTYPMGFVTEMAITNVISKLDELYEAVRHVR